MTDVAKLYKAGKNKKRNDGALLRFSSIFTLVSCIFLLGNYNKRIFSALKENTELKLDINSSNNFFIVNLFEKDKVPDEVPNKVPDNLTINQKKILELIKMNKSISMAQMADEIGISKRKILDNINKLKSINLLERVGNTKSSYWKVTSQE